MATLQTKLNISLGSAFLFAVINSPILYKITTGILPLNLFNNTTNCPTNVGLLVHTLVFLAISYLSMGNANIKKGIKLKHSIYGALIFFLISSPTMYSFTSSVFGSSIASLSGCPTMFGILLHALIYCAALVGVMYLP